MGQLLEGFEIWIRNSIKHPQLSSVLM